MSWVSSFLGYTTVKGYPLGFFYARLVYFTSLTSDSCMQQQPLSECIFCIGYIRPSFYRVNEQPRFLANKKARPINLLKKTVKERALQLAKTVKRIGLTLLAFHGKINT